MSNMSFSRSKMNQTWLFECKQFFKVWHVEKFLIQNLTRFFFNLKCDLFYFFQSKIWDVVEIFIQTLLFKSTFQIFAELFQSSTNIKD